VGWIPIPWQVFLCKAWRAGNMVAIVRRN